MLDTYLRASLAKWFPDIRTGSTLLHRNGKRTNAAPQDRLSASSGPCPWNKAKVSPCCFFTPKHQSIKFHCFYFQSRPRIWPFRTGTAITLIQATVTGKSLLMAFSPLSCHLTVHSSQRQFYPVSPRRGSWMGESLVNICWSPSPPSLGWKRHTSRDLVYFAHFWIPRPGLMPGM